MRRVSTAQTIVHILDSGAIGGGPKVLLTTARGLRMFGWASSAICGDDGPLAEDLMGAGVPVEALPIAGQYRFLAGLPKMIRQLRRHRPAAVMVYGPIAGCLGGLAARMAGVGRILYSAQYPSYYSDEDPLRRVRNAIAERIACGCANVVCCASSGDRAMYLNRRAARPDKFQVINMCVAEDLLRELSSNALDSRAAALRRSLGLVQDEIVIGYVGRLVPEKGVDVFLRACPRIFQALSHARVVITGDGPERVNLEELARELGVFSRVIFAGAHRDIAPFYRLADAIVIPSRYEPGGTVAIEAMAAGRPVVASAVNAFSDTIADGRCGRLVPPGQPDAIADAVLWALQSPAHAHQLGAYGRERVLREYTEEQMAARVNQLLHDRPAAQAEPGTERTKREVQAPAALRREATK